MLKQIEKDGHIIEYCTICDRETDAACVNCDHHKPMFTQDITGKTYYHGFKKEGD